VNIKDLKDTWNLEKKRSTGDFAASRELSSNICFN
jgi:hypothetical protein